MCTYPTCHCFHDNSQLHPGTPAWLLEKRSDLGPGAEWGRLPMLRRSGMLRTTLDRWGFQKLIERFHSIIIINRDSKNVAFKICDRDCLDGGGLVCLSFLLHLKAHSFRDKKDRCHQNFSQTLYLSISVYKYSNYIIHLVVQLKSKKSTY